MASLFSSLVANRNDSVLARQIVTWLAGFSCKLADLQQGDASFPVFWSRMVETSYVTDFCYQICSFVATWILKMTKGNNFVLSLKAHWHNACLMHCMCGGQLHCCRDRKFSIFQHCTLLPQLHTSNTRRVNEPFTLDASSCCWCFAAWRSRSVRTLSTFPEFLNVASRDRAGSDDCVGTMPQSAPSPPRSPSRSCCSDGPGRGWLRSTVKLK